MAGPQAAHWRSAEAVGSTATNWPWLHSLHGLHAFWLPALVKVPLLQAEQLRSEEEVPVAVMYWPGLQGVHRLQLLRPAADQDPAEQGLQPSLPDEEEKVPAGHAVQVPERE